MSTTQPDTIIDSFGDIGPHDIAFAPRLPNGLFSGDVMSRVEFHERYQRAGDCLRAELIDGVVYVGLPVSLSHGVPDQLFNVLLGLYAGNTKGVQCSPNTTIILGSNDEPQPDLLLRILPEYGGQSRTETPDGFEYVVGAPEFIVEVANSSRSIDLHSKRRSYQRAGVLEYLVYSVEERQLFWFDLPNNAALTDAPEGVIRVRSFPGLWIDGVAICHSDFAKAFKTLEAGLAPPEHAEFVNRLEAQRAKLAADSQPAAE